MLCVSECWIERRVTAGTRKLIWITHHFLAFQSTANIFHGFYSHKSTSSLRTGSAEIAQTPQPDNYVGPPGSAYCTKIVYLSRAHLNLAMSHIESSLLLLYSPKPHGAKVPSHRGTLFLSPQRVKNEPPARRTFIPNTFLFKKKKTPHPITIPHIYLYIQSTKH